MGKIGIPVVPSQCCATCNAWSVKKRWGKIVTYCPRQRQVIQSDSLRDVGCDKWVRETTETEANRLYDQL
jgi:hypothetical protein